MSKIIVPQELECQIIDLYNEGKTRKNIHKELNLPFGDSVIKRILIEHQIPIRSNPGSKVGGRKVDKVDEEVEQAIIDLYVNKKYGMNKISRELKLDYSFDKVKAILKRNGVQLRTVREALAISNQGTEFRKYSINDDYNLLSHNGAWLLGFVAADGCLPINNSSHNRIVISLSAVDRDVLELIKHELNYTGPIYEYEASLNGKMYPEVSLAFTSKKLRAQFEQYGIVNKKTFLLKHLPNLPDEYMVDFIRGYFDGDGSIYWDSSKNGLKLSITSTNKEFLEEINKFLHSYLSLKYKGTLNPDHSAYQLSWGINDSAVIAAAFYDNTFLALPRKKNKYLLRKQLPRA